MTQSITIPRGHNIGKSIKEAISKKILRNKVNILTFDFVRNPKERTITATITYNYK